LIPKSSHTSRLEVEIVLDNITAVWYSWLEVEIVLDNITAVREGKG